MSDGGKGSNPRPYSVSNEEYNSRWDAIFSRDIKEEKQNLDSVNGSTTISKIASEGSNPSRDTNQKE